MKKSVWVLLLVEKKTSSFLFFLFFFERRRKRREIRAGLFFCRVSVEMCCDCRKIRSKRVKETM
jgi:hypothetical protein